MDALLFQLQGFSSTITSPCLFGGVTLQGPSSITKPVKDEHPGPENDQHDWTLKISLVFRKLERHVWTAATSLTSVKPEDDRVINGIIATLEEPANEDSFNQHGELSLSRMRAYSFCTKSEGFGSLTRSRSGGCLVCRDSRTIAGR